MNVSLVETLLRETQRGNVRLIHARSVSLITYLLAAFVCYQRKKRVNFEKKTTKIVLK